MGSSVTKPQQFVLDNGLQVILAETHASPVISTWLWYRVGSRNEDGLPTGLSHWVEHMLFKGTQRYPKGSIMRLVSQHGGYANALTSQDFTAYYATVARDRVGLVLDYEADRMAGALFDPDEVASERSVILSEREGGENEPRQVLSEEVSATAFRRHPYRHQTIGWREDLLRITRDDLYDYYRTFYVPGNAVLVMVGDLDTATMLQEIEQRFSPLQGQAPAPRDIPQEPEQVGERRVNLHLPGAATLLEVGYHAPQAAHADFLPLVVTAALLSGGKSIYSFSSGHSRSSRLYRTLVETELATSADCEYYANLDPYLFSLGATVRKGVEPAVVEEALFAEITRLQETPASPEEMAMAIRQTEAHFAYSSESVTSHALTLGFSEMVESVSRLDTVLEELRQVTPEDVMRVSQQYLSPARRTVGWYIPDESRTPATAGGLVAEIFARRRFWALNDAPQGLAGSPVIRETFDNGITVLLQRRDTSAAVAIGGRVPFGTFLDDPDKPGITYVTSSMLRRGTQTRTFQEINRALDQVGAAMSVATGRDELSIGGRCLGQDLDTVIDLLGEMLREPSFDERELERLRGQILTRMAELDRDTSYRANLAFIESLYTSEHPYGRPLMGQAESISNLTAEDLRALYRQHLHPQNAIFALVGSLDPDAVIAQFEATLGSWRPDSTPPPPERPAVELPVARITRTIDIPARPQLDLVFGVLSMRRHSADYYAGVVANVILGELGMMGRLGASIRDELGLVYDIGSDLYANRAQRPWIVSAGVAPEHLDETIAGIEGEIDRMREQLVSREEMDDARTLLIGSLPLHLETNEGIAGYLLNVAAYDLGLDYVSRYPDLVGSVTAQDVREVMQRYWPRDRAVITAAGTLSS